MKRERIIKNIIVIYVLITIMFFVQNPMYLKIYKSAIRNAGYIIKQGSEIETNGVVANPFDGIIMLLFPQYIKYKSRDWRCGILVLPLAIDNDRKNNYMTMKKAQSKMSWYMTFKRNGIDTPQVYMYNGSDGKKKEIRKVDENEDCLMKPDNGTEGAGIKVIKRGEYEKKGLKNYVLQERLSDYEGKIRHWRIISIRGKMVTVKIKENLKEGTITTNNANDDKVENLISEYKRYEEFINEYKYIHKDKVIEMCRKIEKLHIEEYNITPLMGWDIMITKEGPKCLEGNIGCGVPEMIREEYLRILKEEYSKI